MTDPALSKRYLNASGDRCCIHAFPMDRPCPSCAILAAQEALDSQQQVGVPRGLFCG